MDPFYLALMLYVLAMVLAVVDLFVPSGGMLIAMAVLAAIGSVLFGFRSGTTLGMTMLTLVVASVPTFAVIAIKIWPHTPIGRRIILGLPKPREDAKSVESDPLQTLVGSVFLAEHALLPTGHLRIGHRRLNAVAESGIVEVGERVKIVAVRERNLIVRVTEEPLSAPIQVVPSADKESSEKLLGDDQKSPQNLLELSAEELGLDSIEE
jgi:membrane-bound ClpP family serine protease